MNHSKSYHLLLSLGLGSPLVLDLYMEILGHLRGVGPLTAFEGAAEHLGQLLVGPAAGVGLIRVFLDTFEPF